MFGVRTVKSWVRYNPNKKVIETGYRTKTEAQKRQKVGEVIFNMKGYYVPGMVKKVKRKKK